MQRLAPPGRLRFVAQIRKEVRLRSPIDRELRRDGLRLSLIWLGDGSARRNPSRLPRRSEPRFQRAKSGRGFEPRYRGPEFGLTRFMRTASSSVPAVRRSDTM